MRSLAGRVAKWSLFALAMLAVNSPEFYGLPDFTSVCYDGVCYDAVRVSPDQNSQRQEQHERR